MNIPVADIGGTNSRFALFCDDQNGKIWFHKLKKRVIANCLKMS